jgi:hypothetical protein
MRPVTPSVLELEAACGEAAELRAQERALKLKQALALMAEGMGMHTAARRVRMSARVLRRALEGEVRP